MCKSSNYAKTLTYRPDIDGLRAIAVLAVVFFHADIAFLSGGFIGVDIFFVISGFLITSILLKDLRNDSFSMVTFWVRRAKRILPALIAVIVFCLIVGWFLFLPEDYKNLGQQVVSQGLLASNILFYLQSGYFDSANDIKPLLHTWSLALEEQFYLFYPIGLFLLWRFINTIKIIYVLSGLFLLSLGLSIYGVEHHPSATFYLLPTRAWELLIGAIIAIIPAPLIKKSYISHALAALAIMVLILPMILYTSNTPFPGVSAILPCGGAALLIWIQARNATIISKVLSLKIFVSIGLISYSWYLWHWPFLVFTKYYLYEGAPQSALIFAVFASFFMAILSWKFIEQPFRSHGNQPQSNKRAAFALIGILFLTVGFSLYVYKGDGIPSRLDQDVVTFAAGGKDMNDRTKECQKIALIPLKTKGGCEINGSSQNKHLFYSFGDSFSATLSPTLNVLSAEYDIAGLQSFYSSCPPVFGVERVYISDKAADYSCHQYNDIVKGLLIEKKIKNVILFARWSAYMHEYEITNIQNNLDPSESQAFFEHKLIETLLFYKQNNITVWILEQPPEYTVNVPRHLALNKLINEDKQMLVQSVAEYEDRQKEINTIFDKIKNDDRFDMVHFLDTSDLFCQDGENCVTQYEGRSLYRDTNHLSQTGVQYISSLFIPMFEAIKKGRDDE